MGLHVDVFTPEQLFGASNRQLFNGVHVLAAAVIASSRVALRVLVGHQRPLRGLNRGAGVIFRRNQHEFFTLTFFFGAKCRVYLGVFPLNRFERADGVSHPLFLRPFNLDGRLSSFDRRVYGFGGSLRFFSPIRGFLSLRLFTCFNE